MAVRWSTVFLLFMGAIVCTGSRLRKGSPKPADMSGPTAKFVNETINNDTIVIFSKSSCPYSIMAKDVFTKLKAPYTSVELDTRDDGNEIQSVLFEITGARTVPRVFLKGEFIGGGSDVKALYENGKLEQMLEKSIG